MKFKKIYIEITNKCNKNCSFCSKSKKTNREMTTLEFLNIIHQIKEYTDYIYLHVKGESLLHSEFSNIIKICDENNIKVNITTNGTLLKKYYKIISSSKSIRQINISLHSYQDNDNINDLLNFVDYIINNTNIYIVYRYWTLSNSLLLEYKNIFDVIFKHYSLSKDKIDQVIADKNIKILNNLYINKDYEFEWPSLSNKNYGIKGHCNGLKTHIAILSDGTVVPCCLDADGIISLGNIYESSLKEILSTTKAVNIINGFRNNKKVESLCQHCSFNR